MREYAALGAISSENHLCGIERISNGYVVRFQRPVRAFIKSRGLNDMGFDPEIKEFLRAAKEKMKEGEGWKDAPASVRNQLESLEGSQTEIWRTQTESIACKDEGELLVAIRLAMAASNEIERLALAGEFSGPGPAFGM